MEQPITVRLPDDLLRAAEEKAAGEGRSVDSLLEDGLRLVLNAAANKRPAGGERKMPRVSSATGGLRPGVDIAKFSEIEQATDRAYSERLKTGLK